MNEEENGGDGGESDVEGDEFDIHHDSLVIDSEESDDKCVEVDDKDKKGRSIGFVDLTAEGSTKVVGKVHMLQHAENEVLFENAKRNVKIPGAPPDWKVPAVAPKRGEPKWSSVDNPGDWPRYCFAPVFADRKKK